MRTLTLTIDTESDTECGGCEHQRIVEVDDGHGWRISRLACAVFDATLAYSTLEKPRRCEECREAEKR